MANIKKVLADTVKYGVPVAVAVLIVLSIRNCDNINSLREDANQNRQENVARDSVISELRDGTEHLRERIDTVEERVGAVEGRVDVVEERIGVVESRVDSIAQRVDSLENRVDKNRLCRWLRQLHRWLRQLNHVILCRRPRKKIKAMKLLLQNVTSRL